MNRLRLNIRLIISFIGQISMICILAYLIQNLNHNGQTTDYSLIEAINYTGENINLSAILIGLIIIAILTTTINLIINHSFQKFTKSIKILSSHLKKGEFNNSLFEDTKINDFNLSEIRNNLKLHINNINFKINNITQTATELKTASIQLSRSSQSISKDTKSQDQIIQKIFSKFEQITYSNIEVSNKANISKRLALETANEMNSIKDAFTSNMQMIHEIFEKIEQINNISFKTNALIFDSAMNTSFNGELKSNLMVLANEINKSIEESKSVSNEIETLLWKQLKANKISEELIDRTLLKIIRVIELSNEIDKKNDVSTDTLQLNNAIQYLYDLNEHNSNTARDLFHKARKITVQFEQLKDMIDFLKIKESQKTDAVNEFNRLKQKNDIIMEFKSLKYKEITREIKESIQPKSKSQLFRLKKLYPNLNHLRN